METKRIKVERRVNLGNYEYATYWDEEVVPLEHNHFTHFYFARIALRNKLGHLEAVERRAYSQEDNNKLDREITITKQSIKDINQKINEEIKEINK